MNGRPRRYLHVFSTFGAGGPQIRAVQLMNGLGAHVQHVVMAMDGCTDARAQLAATVDCTFVPPPAKAGWLTTVRTQARWLRQQAPDLVLTYNWGAIETAAAARRLRLPLVHHEDGFLPDEVQQRLRRRSWLRRLVLRAVPVVVPSRVLQRIAAAEWRLPVGNVHHFPNGVDLARFQPAAAAPTMTIGTVGGLRPEKDHETLLRALAQLDAGVRATIVGGGALAEPLRTTAQALGVAGRVQFAGPVTDTAPWYAAFAVFVLSSRTEQMPIAMLEAMACGLPVVATDVGDVRAILPEAQGEYVLPLDRLETAEPLAQKLIELAQDGSKRSALGAANRKRVEERYGFETMLAAYREEYERALAR